MNAVDLIRKKRDGARLTDREIEAFVQGAASGEWPDYQIAAMLMAIYFQGMSSEETAHLSGAMVASGAKLDLSGLPGFKVDKHSTGGVGDKTSLILAPLAAACGCVVPMMSGRGLGHTGGTLDKLEAIPGFRVNLSISELHDALAKIGCGLIGQTQEIAPADKVLYALRDVTATVESIPLITSSIMSKKIAEGIDGLVLDVKFGKGAFMKTREAATELAHSLISTGLANGVKTVAYLTSMEAPLGFAVGHSLEIMECLETLKGRGPADLETLSLALASRMLQLSSSEFSVERAEEQIRQALSSGRGVQKFAEIVEGQGGDPRVIDDYERLPGAPHVELLSAETNGFITDIHAERVGRAAMHLGGGRRQVTDSIDHAVGIVLKVCVGEKVATGEPLAEIHYRNAAALEGAREMLSEAICITGEPPAPQPRIVEFIDCVP